MKNSHRIRVFRKLITLSRNAINQYGFRYFVTTAILEIRHNGFAIFKPEPETRIINTYSEKIAYKTWLREHELTNKKIQQDIYFSSKEVGIEKSAREMGLVKPGEIQYRVIESNN